MAENLKLFNEHSEYESFIQTEEFIRPNVSYCIEENEVHYNPIIGPYNGHEYVDLGLPSGTLWATMNVGATSETDYGLYFAWGDTQGYTASQVGTGSGQKAFSWNDYVYGTQNNLTKYNSTDGLTILESTDDAAVVNMGGSWHMPSKNQMVELCNSTYVTSTWVIDYQGSGVNGRLFTSVADSSKTLFFPASGYCGGSVMSVNGLLYMWSRSIYERDQKSAWPIYAYSGGTGMYNEQSRCSGFTVRGVVGELTN